MDLNINNSPHISITNGTENDGEYLWTVQIQGNTGTDFKISVRDGDLNNFYFDFSDEVFTIIRPECEYQISSPNGGEQWEVGSSKAIRWTQNQGFCSDQVNINLLKNNTFEQVLAANTSNDNSFLWSIPENLTPDEDYKIEIIDVDNTAITEISDMSFSIIEQRYCNLEVIYPNGRL